MRATDFQGRGPIDAWINLYDRQFGNDFFLIRLHGKHRLHHWVIDFFQIKSNATPGQHEQHDP
jgi:hypothetical protein